ncbi:hypothetical protein C2G38_1662930 [Gigaspora rosea]|uniref:TLDc domain-containing protein n=1 Tax=Gigaspora rosea TaxID=44941 RepID=A0A397W911_9GLOM|nr:hypothetical protein C2G38_1662930 [Gigaspora rosea]
MFPELVDHFQNILIDNNASWLRLNFSHVCQISFQNKNFVDLQKFCNDIIAKYPKMIFDSDNLNTLQENALISLLKNDDLQMDESEIWDKVILWGKAKTPNLPPNLKEWTDDNFKSLKTTLQNCLPHIRYFQISGEDVLKKINPYRNILDENTWDDIMSKLVAPNSPISSLILPPRKKAAVQLPPRKKTTVQLPPRNVITPSSSIITLQHAAEISSWIDRRSTIYDDTEIPYEFKLLLKGSRDGFSSERFHRLCDTIPGTVVVVEVLETNEILGGYNPLIWKVSNENAATADSFIFSLKNENMNQSILSRVTIASRAIYYGGISLGPSFGSCAFGMKGNKWCYHSSGYGYDPIRSKDGDFYIKEYEVFQICKI